MSGSIEWWLAHEGYEWLINHQIQPMSSCYFLISREQVCEVQCELGKLKFAPPGMEHGDNSNISIA